MSYDRELIASMLDAAVRGDSGYRKDAMAEQAELLRSAELRALAGAEVGGWRSMESAPRDGTVFLAWRFYVVAVKWTGDAEYPWEAVNLGSHFSTALSDNGFMENDSNLTGWQPLPTPPGSGRGGD